MNLLSEIIPKAMFEHGIDLKEIGINEYAWNRNNIEDIINILAKKKIVVLGGDVYRISNDNIQMTYDSWYVNNDGSEYFYIKSYVVALNYIDEYEKNNLGNFLYTITI